MDTVSDRDQWIHSPRLIQAALLYTIFEVGLDLLILLQQVALELLKPPNVSNVGLDGEKRAEEQLEQKLDPLRHLFHRLREPVQQFRFAPFGQGVDVALWLSLLPFCVAGGQPLPRKLFQDGVDLSVTLAPEVGGALLHELSDSIAGNGLQGKHAQDRVPALVLFCHISPRYVSKRCIS